MTNEPVGWHQKFQHGRVLPEAWDEPFEGVRGVRPLDPMGHDPDDFTPRQRRKRRAADYLGWVVAALLLSLIVLAYLLAINWHPY